MSHLIRLLALTIVLAGVFLALPSAASANSPVIDPHSSKLTPEEQLALKYAPIAYLKTQTGPCDDVGEPYAPAPVDVIFNDPQVSLRATTTGQPVLAAAPNAATLANRGKDVFLRLPGDPLNPGCSYEEYFKAKMGATPPMVYAHIATQPGHDRIALQYWFYYVYNRFNNLHESDWEMIQLTFSASTPAEALATTPDEIAFAQHGGGEYAAWDSVKLQKEGDHPIVFPASGSHAAYFGRFIYVGWGEHGSGLGCDDTTGPSRRTALAVSMMPDHPTASGPFAWLTFTGRWGDLGVGPFNGPTGPNTKAQWSKPFDWQDGLRASSVPLPPLTSIGFSPARLLCNAVPIGSELLILHNDYALITYFIVATIIGLPLLFLALAWRTLFGAGRVFVRHPVVFLSIGSVLFVAGSFANIVQDFFERSPIGAVIIEAFNLPLQQGLFIQSGNSIQQIVGWLLVTPAVIYAVLEIQAGRKPSITGAYRFAIQKTLGILIATAQVVAMLGLMAITIVGIPVAINRLVRWTLVSQAIAIEGGNWRDARKLSQQAVIGRWWRTAMLAVAITILNALVAPVIGLIVLMFVTPSVAIAQTVSSLVYTLLFPLVGIAMTLWYQQRTSR